ncbi:hypothetical protein [Azohydromonas lata]|uniref:hypothetical protein n=1 Tax=Azohydromonas lata TaxID=45677 RepID=UPI0012F4EE92|nr:hypothetical protein [Azohydromonas lata]
MKAVALQTKQVLGGACAALVLAATSPGAHAFDSCKVLLCLAGPWQSISECVPDVTEFLRCWSRGKCSLSCSQAGTVSWASSANCPPQYGLYEYDVYGQATLVGCTKSGVIDVNWQGMPNWTRVWWTMGGTEEPVIEYSDAARSLLGEHVNPQFDEDYATWLASQPKPADNCYLYGCSSH